MLKTFSHIWKNATVRKYQIVLKRHASSVVSQVNLCQFNSDNQLYWNFQIKSRTHLNTFDLRKSCHQIRWISNSKTIDNSNSVQCESVASKYENMDAKWRADPVITTLDTPQFKGILRKNILDLVALFQKYNYEIRIAGGAVR